MLVLYEWNGPRIYKNSGNVRLRIRNDDQPEVQEFEKVRYSQKDKNFTRLPSYTFLIVLIIEFLLFGLAYNLHYTLPTPLYIKDIDSNPNRFIAERAFNHLKQLTDFGSKPVGSYENEVLTVEFLTREISFIMQQANPKQMISFDIQKCTGSFTLAFKPHGTTNYYSQVQNIVVKLNSKTNSTSSLLINCHFDSVPTSPGGSDDGLNCAVMLEVLKILARSNTPLKHNVIFLFNGAEESQLQGSHGFITQHKWSHEVKAFINLEACGAGGREVLFQAGPNSPLACSDSVPYPHGQVTAEDIFQSGLVPSDTDFRVFRDFGNVPGLDFAHAMNGYVYHTSYDNLNAIPMGTVQHTGDNLLSLIKHIASSDVLSDTQEYASGRMVYYDFLGFFMVRYSETVGIIFNVLTVILSLYAVAQNIISVKSGSNRASIWTYIALSCGVPALGWLLGLFSTVIVAVILDNLYTSMSWFTRPYFVFGLYYCPVLACCMVVTVLSHEYVTKKIFLNPDTQGRLHVNGVQLLWSIILLMGTIFGIRSTFMFMLLTLFPTLSSFVLSFTHWHNKTRLWLIVYISSTLPTTIFVLYHTIMAFGLFIPITGRIGPDKNPDIIIGIFAALLCVLASCYIIPLIILVRSPWRTLAGISGLHLLALLAVILTPLGFPYSGNPSAPSPQRMYIFHTERTFHDLSGHIVSQDAGFWLADIDHNSPHSVSSLIPEVANAQLVGPACEKDLVCGIPIYSTRILATCKHSHWIPAPPPALLQPTNLELNSENDVSERRKNYTFTVSGPDRIVIVLSPSAKILNWSFNEDISESGYYWQNKPTYFISYIHGLAGTPFKFWLDLEITKESTAPILDIAVIGHYINRKDYISEEFKKFLAKYPDWAHITAWASSYKAWKF